MLKLVSATIALIIVGLFLFLNSNQRVVLHLLFTTLKDFPLALACLLFLIIGLVISIPFFLTDRMSLLKKQKQEIRRLNTYLESTRNELKELEKKLKESEVAKSRS